MAVGNPFNLTSTVTAGIVSAKARTLGVYGIGGVESFIQTDAAINQGNSGGALVNAKGELVGINAVLSSPTGAYAGYGFAIPTSVMTKVVSDLKQYGTVQRALLGIKGTSLAGDGDMMSDQPIDKSGATLSDKRKEFGVVDGVWVREIVDGGSAAGSDIKVDDVIIGIDGKKVQNFADLQEAIAQHRPGDKVTVKVMRDKKGVHNSFESPDSINAIDWNRKTTHEDVFAYYKRLISIRKAHPAFRMGDAEMVRKHLEFLPVDGGNLVAFRLKDRANGDTWDNIIVALNARSVPAKLAIPEGKYTVVCRDGVIDERGLGLLYGPEVTVPAQSALIIHQ